jgi:polyphosphate glucokinase
MKILGIDIGGSALKGVPVDIKSGKLLDAPFRIETPIHFHWSGPIGVGFPGVVNDGIVRTSANLDKRFVDTDLERLLKKTTGCRVHVLNDADAAGIAEMRFGAGKKHLGKVLLLTLGTGIGSALFYRGVLFPNTELGHLPLKNLAAEKWAAASIRKAEELSWRDWGKRLDSYLTVLETVLTPDLFILGGGVSARNAKFFKYLKRHTPIVPAKFLNEAGIVGAAIGAMPKQ